MTKEVENKEVAVEEVVEEVAVDEVAKAKAKKAPKTNAKKLTLAELQKQSKKLDATSEGKVMIGDTEYTIEYDTVFRKTKQRNVLDDTLRFFQEIGEQNIDRLEMASAYTALLIVKHFTSLEISDDVSEALDMLEVLVDLEVLGEIVNLLPEDEVVKIYDLLTTTVNTLKENIEETERQADLIEAEIENEEVKELVTPEPVEEDGE